MSRIKKAALLATISMIGVLFLILRGPDDAQINLMTGDLRYRVFRIPVSYHRLKPPYSDWLQTISSGNDRWVTVATFPLPTSNNSHFMCRHFYASAATWVTIDPTIARSALNDLEQYIISTGARYSLPASIPLLAKVNFQDGNTAEIEKDWRSDPWVQDYLEARRIQK